MKASNIGLLNVLVLAEFEDCQGLLAPLRTYCTLFCNRMTQALEGIQGGFVPDIVCIDPRQANSANLVEEIMGRFPGHEFVVVSVLFFPKTIRNAGSSTKGVAVSRS